MRVSVLNFDTFQLWTSWRVKTGRNCSTSLRRLWCRLYQNSWLMCSSVREEAWVPLSCCLHLLVLMMIRLVFVMHRHTHTCWMLSCYLQFDSQGGKHIFPFSKMSILALGLLFIGSLGVSFPWVKLLDHESDHWPPLEPKAWVSRPKPPLHPSVFVAWTGQHRLYHVWGHV